MPDSTLAPNQFATFDEYERARNEHDRDAASILNQIVGASSEDMNDDLKARMWDVYAEEVREWAVEQPEWVR